MNGRFEGKRVLVTGGTTGIGRAAAERFHAEGAHVAITGRSEASVAAARATLPASVLALASDASSVVASEALVRGLGERWDGLDVLFVNAGIAAIAPFEHATEASFDAHFDTNVRGVFFLIQKALPLLAPNASIIVNTSTAALKGAPGMSVYSASKGAVSALVRTLAVELAPRGIRVNAIAPAMIHTPIQAKFGLPPEVLEGLAKDASAKIPLGRFGEASEVVELVLFLASAPASFVTGVEVPVDGGLMVA